MVETKVYSVEETLKNIIGRVLHQDNPVLNPAGTFKELGADSMDVVQIMVALEEQLDIELLDKELKNISNMAGFIAYIQQKVDARKNRLVKSG
jgi:acyl carrier protein